MPNKGANAAEHEKESGARRMSGKTHEEHLEHLVPTTESTKEAGPRRLYAAPSSTSSTSTKESGPRRFYASASGSPDNRAAKS